MRRILIIYKSQHGQTEKICYYMKDKFKEKNFFCEIHDLAQFEPELVKYDTVIIGAPVYAGRYNKKLLAWTLKNSDELNKKKTTFFTVTLNAADKRAQARKDDQRLINEFLIYTHLQPRFTASIAGALKYLEYNWLMRLIMKQISKKAGGPTDTSKNFEMTNWQVVDAFVDAIEQDDRSSQFAYSKNLDDLSPKKQPKAEETPAF